MEFQTYNQKGEEAGKVILDDNVFNVTWNPDLVHQVVVSMQSNLRNAIAHAKTRGEVRGGGIKPWRQKGTGRARHGSIRSPIWVGGGVAHGPLKEENYKKKINDKMKKAALYSVLSQKLKDNEILILEDLKLESAKTKEADKIVLNLGKIKGFERLAKKGKNRAEILVIKKEEGLKRAFNNIYGVELAEARNLNPLEVLTFKYLIFTKEAVETLVKPKMEKIEKTEKVAKVTSDKSIKIQKTRKIKKVVEKEPVKVKATAKVKVAKKPKVSKKKIKVEPAV